MICSLVSRFFTSPSVAGLDSKPLRYSTWGVGATLVAAMRRWAATITQRWLTAQMVPRRSQGAFGFGKTASFIN